jgi:hypothetical protein
MLPDAPSSDYFLLTAIILATGVVPLAVVFHRARRRNTINGAAVSASIPRWIWLVWPSFLVIWWFAAAWLFLRD